MKTLISFKYRIEYFSMSNEVTCFAQIIFTPWAMEKITHIYYRLSFTFITSCSYTIIIRVFCAKFKGMTLCTFGYLNLFSIYIKSIFNFFIFVIIFFQLICLMNTTDPKAFSFLMIVKNILRISYCIELSIVWQHNCVISSIFIFIHELFVFFIFIICRCLRISLSFY
jgi:hypothetical protein